MEKINYEEQLKQLINQEETLQFSAFNNITALEIGLDILNSSKSLNRPITIDISKNRQQIFHYSFEGTSPDNDQWIIRKNNIVNRFNRSSYYISTRLKALDMTIEEKYNLSSSDYAPYGGAFPIIIKDVGVIGTISVSGLTQEEDHNLVVDAIRKYLQNY